MTLSKTTKTVKAENLCDICKKVLSPYYDTYWYIHYCSKACFNVFLKGYNIEIDEIAIEIKDANELFKEENNE